MAVVVPYDVDEDAYVDEDEANYWDCLTESGLSGGKRCPRPEHVAGGQHAVQERAVYVRQLVLDALSGKHIAIDIGTPSNITLQVGSVVGGEFVAEPLQSITGWASLADPISAVGLLAWTTKMNCPSFSLPAGSGLIGGSCPGATAGQSVVPATAQKKALEKLRSLNVIADAPLPTAICHTCYAMGKGNYQYTSKHYAQSIIYAWTKQAVKTDSPVPGFSSMFVYVMDMAVRHVNYRLESFRQKKDIIPREPTQQRFFRIHDSGDFYSEEYLAQWNEVCHLNPDIHFWAPSRIWATNEWVQVVASNKAPNLTLRPSAFYVGQAGPNLPPPWDATTTVTSGRTEVYDWACDAYAEGSNRACRTALRPDSVERGCRACWTQPQMIVNYSPH